MVVDHSTSKFLAIRAGKWRSCYMNSVRIDDESHCFSYESTGLAAVVIIKLVVVVGLMIMG